MACGEGPYGFSFELRRTAPLAARGFVAARTGNGMAAAAAPAPRSCAKARRERAGIFGLRMNLCRPLYRRHVRRQKAEGRRQRAEGRGQKWVACAGSLSVEVRAPAFPLASL